jgi:radical SAM-linked protein
MKIRVRYTKLGKIRWISHRDVARAMERAFRVVQLPLAFSEGFSPHPKVSFGLALSTGHESEAEYLDVVLTRDVDLDAMCAQMSDALPEGIDVVGAAPLVDRAPALQEAVTAVTWRVNVEGTDVRDRVAAGLAAASLTATRRRKGREVVEDVRPVVRSMNVIDDATVEMEMNTQPRGAKPGEVLAAIGGLTEVRALRTHQWIERDGARLEPLDADTRVMREGIDVRSGPSRGRDDHTNEPAPGGGRGAIAVG